MDIIHRGHRDFGRQLAMKDPNIQPKQYYKHKHWSPKCVNDLYFNKLLFTGVFSHQLNTFGSQFGILAVRKGQGNVNK